MFVERATARPSGEPLAQKALPTPNELAAAGARVVNELGDRLLLENHFYLSGEIPRITAYERGFSEQLSRAADRQGWVSDPLIRDERYLAAHVRDVGIVVFTACSHAGVINVLKDARRIFGPIPLYGVMGGFHLSGKVVENTIADTVRDLQEFSLKRIIPAHCTGWRAIHALANVFTDDILVPSAVGRTFNFGASG
jgi:7,8-dihydropterin-6-yl-methyl-4-(beta-D-ribofuranosyl)aminobenzene 5'-phosphate synthase